MIELDLYFMTIYLCMKYESNTPMYSKDIARKPLPKVSLVSVWLVAHHSGIFKFDSSVKNSAKILSIEIFHEIIFSMAILSQPLTCKCVRHW